MLIQFDSINFRLNYIFSIHIYFPFVFMYKIVYLFVTVLFFFECVLCLSGKVYARKTYCFILSTLGFSFSILLVVFFG